MGRNIENIHAERESFWAEMGAADCQYRKLLTTQYFQFIST